MAIDRSPNKPNWSELHHDILVYIFSMVNVLDRIINVVEVCSSWRAAASDEKFYKTLDISKYRQQAVPRNPRGSRAQILRLTFQRGINLGHVNLTTLVFDPPFYVNDRHLLYAAQRCPNLEEVVLPFPSSVTNSGLKRAFQYWPKLQSLFLAFNAFYHPPTPIFKIVRVHCPNLSVLKLCCCFFDEATVKAIARYMPRLKVLSTRCAFVPTNVTEAFSSMEHLEEVYISVHNTIVAETFPDVKLLQSVIDDNRNQKKLPRLRVYHACYWEECFECMAATMGNPPLNVADLFAF